MGLIIGVIVCYQILFTDIANNIMPFATLKAMGYGNAYLASVVLQQAVLYGFLGYLPGLGLSLFLYEWGGAAAALPLTMTWQRAVIVLAMSIGMCAVSGFFAVKKVKTADPADLF